MKTIDNSNKIVRVLVVENQKSVGLNLRLYLESHSQIEVVDVAEDGITALEKIAELLPDIAIIDLEMPGINGITTIEIINERFPQTQTLVLSIQGQQECIHQAIVAGAKGYLLKDVSAEELNEAVLKINQGYFQLDKQLSEKMALDSKESLEEDYLTVGIDKIDLLPAEETIAEQNNTPEVASEQMTEMRREIIDILEFKIHVLEDQKNHINLSFQKLQRRFSWLMASQCLLLFMVLGSTSTALRLKQQSQSNVQNVNVVNTSQSVK